MHIIQDILIVLLAGYMTIDQNGPVVMSWFSVIVGTISGLIMGDLNTGLMIGGTFQLMSLGVAALGGASAPNYGLATIIGTFIAVRTGTGIDAAVGVGLPVGLLAIQLEVVVRIVNNFVAHKMQSDNNEGKWKNMNRIAWVGPLLCSLQTIIPTVIVVCFGANVVNFILDVIPQWVTDGLSIAAGMLPVVGIGMLMRYMPVKKFLPFILIGFILSAYLSMPVLGIAIVGFAAAFWYFTTEMKKAAEAEKAVAVTTVDEMGDAKTFHGYAPDLGYAFLRDAIVAHDYQARGCDISADEIFVSDGAKSDSGNIQEIFSVILFTRFMLILTLWQEEQVYTMQIHRCGAT